MSHNVLRWEGKLPTNEQPSVANCVITKASDDSYKAEAKDLRSELLIRSGYPFMTV